MDGRGSEITSSQLFSRERKGVYGFMGYGRGSSQTHLSNRYVRNDARYEDEEDRRSYVSDKGCI